MDLLETEKLPRNYCQTVYLNIQKYRMKQTTQNFVKPQLKLSITTKLKTLLGPLHEDYISIYLIKFFMI